MFGSLSNPEERSAAAMKGMGIDPAFAPKFFIWDEATNTMRCPAEKQLDYVGQSRKNRQYLPPISGARGGLRRVPVAFEMLPPVIEGADGVAFGSGECSSGRDAVPDGDSRSEGNLPPARGSSGVSQRVDQGQDRTSQVSRTRDGQSRDGSRLGLPDLQYPALDSSVLEKTNPSGGLKNQVKTLENAKRAARIRHGRPQNLADHPL